MDNVHPYFSLKNAGKPMHDTRQNTVYFHNCHGELHSTLWISKWYVYNFLLIVVGIMTGAFYSVSTLLNQMILTYHEVSFRQHCVACRAKNSPLAVGFRLDDRQMKDLWPRCCKWFTFVLIENTFTPVRKTHEMESRNDYSFDNACFLFIL